MRQILRFVAAVVFTTIFINLPKQRITYAQQQQSTPLLLPADIQAAAAPMVFQGVQSGASGAVHYSEEVLAFPVRPSPENSDLLVTWQKSHKFFVVPINIGVAPTEGLIPDRVDLSV